MSQRILVRGNEIISNAAVSTLVQPTTAAGIPEKGGHPIALKVIANASRDVEIEDNDITTRDYPTGACMSSGLITFDGRTTIRGNRCDMDGQFAGILGGWAGTPGFFPPYYLHDAEVTDNVFVGNGLFGVSFNDFSFNPTPGADLQNEGHATVFRGNDFSGFTPSRSLVYMDLSTHDNVFDFSTSTTVEDYGIDNHFE